MSVKFLGDISCFRRQTSHGDQIALRNSSVLARYSCLGALSLLTLGLLGERIYETWIIRGMFDFIAVDYAIYAATAHVVQDMGWSHLYDTQAITNKIGQLFTPYYGPGAMPLRSGPSPYPACFIFPFLIINPLGPIIGFTAWTVLNALTAFLITHAIARAHQYSGFVLYLLPFVFFPLTYGLYLGQLAVFMTVGVYLFLKSTRSGHEFLAGLALGFLLLKPQFAVILALVLVAKQRWQAVAGFCLAALALAASTVAMVGVDGAKDYREIVRAFSGFRNVPSIVNPHFMINIRGLLVTVLPPRFSEADGTLIVLLSSAVLTLSLLTIWRGPWEPRSDRFPKQLFATLIISMFTGFHNHIHGATLLIVPILAILLNDRTDHLFADLLIVAIFLPTLVIITTGSLIFTAWVLIGLFACIYGVILLQLHQVTKPRGTQFGASAAC
jgi:hypothetical protein